MAVAQCYSESQIRARTACAWLLMCFGIANLVIWTPVTFIDVLWRLGPIPVAIWLGTRSGLSKQWRKVFRGDHGKRRSGSPVRADS